MIISKYHLKFCIANSKKELFLLFKITAEMPLQCSPNLLFLTSYLLSDNAVILLVAQVKAPWKSPLIPTHLKSGRLSFQTVPSILTL